MSEQHDCNRCNGSGYVDVYDEKGVLELKVICPTCEGTGQQPEKEESTVLVLCQFYSPIKGFACSDVVTRCVQCPFSAELGDTVTGGAV